MKTAKFKDSELGPIPEDWEVKRLGEIFSFAAAGDLQVAVSSKTPTNENIWPIYSNTLPQKGLYGYTSCPRYKRGSMTITGRGTLGHAEYRETDFDAIIRLIVMEPSECVDSRFYVSYVNTFAPFPVSISSIPQLTVPQVQETVVPLPPLPEQRRIAEALGEVDKLIESLGEEIQKKRLVAKGLAHDLLGMRNAECGMRNEPIRRLPGFKGEWARKRLGEIGKFYAGLSGKTASDFGKGNARYITFLNILNNTTINEKEVGIVDVRNGEKQNLVKKGDLFFNISSETVEEVAMCAALLTDMPDTYLNSFCCGFRLSDTENDPLFISYFFNGEQGRKTIKGFANGITRYNLSKKAFYEAVVCWPTLTEQRAIAEVLAAADAEIASLEAKRGKYGKIKAGMMRDLLTGQVRI